MRNSCLRWVIQEKLLGKTSPKKSTSVTEAAAQRGVAADRGSACMGRNGLPKQTLLIPKSGWLRLCVRSVFKVEGNLISEDGDCELQPPDALYSRRAETCHYCICCCVLACFLMHILIFLNAKRFQIIGFLQKKLLLAALCKKNLAQLK